MVFNKHISFVAYLLFPLLRLGQMCRGRRAHLQEGDDMNTLNTYNPKKIDEKKFDKILVELICILGSFISSSISRIFDVQH